MEGKTALIYNAKSVTASSYPGDFLKTKIIVIFNKTMHWTVAGTSCTMMTGNSTEWREFIFTERLLYKVLDTLLYWNLKAILCNRY